jgi:hypothetical protein
MSWNPSGSLVAVLLAAVSSFALFACSDEGGSASCMYTDSSGSQPAILMCEEVSANLRDQLRQVCGSLASQIPADAGITMSIKLLDSPCPRQGALGAREATLGGATMTDWYYEQGSGYRTADDLKQFCANAGRKSLSP